VFHDVLRGVHADALDCLQANLAVLADAHHGAGTHLRLGVRPGFDPVFGTGLPHVAATVDDRFREARQLLGLALVERHDHVAPAELVGLLADGRPRYLVADAHLMSWLPYFGQEHMSHSLLAIAEPGGVQVTDAYRNTTRWGEARPGTWRLTESEFVAALATGAETVARWEPRALPVTTASAAPVDPAVVARYVAAYRDHEDRHAAFTALTLDTWLLARQRRLYVARTGDGAAASRLPAWQRLTEQVYLALRRVEFGRAEPTAVFGMLADLLTEEAGPSTRDVRAAVGTTRDTGVRDTIAAVVGRVLGIEPALATTPFRTLPGYDSFRLVELIQETEGALDTELLPDEMMPENFTDLDTLTALFVRAMARGGVHA
jgi:acyl carrier protein